MRNKCNILRFERFVSKWLTHSNKVNISFFGALWCVINSTLCDGILSHFEPFGTLWHGSGAAFRFGSFVSVSFETGILRFS